MLCELCRKIRPRHKRERSEPSKQAYEHSCIFRHHASFDDLIQAALSGCEICLLFKPFIEHAHKVRSKKPEDGEDEDLGSLNSHSHDDPFADFRTTYGLIRLNKNNYYTDEGDCYAWTDYRLDDVNDELGEQITKTVEAEEEEDKRLGLIPSKPKNGIDKSEVMQWLLHGRPSLYGREQLWVRSWKYSETYSPEVPGHSENSFFITLSVGSIDYRGFGDFDGCCVDDGPTLAGKKSFAFAYPELTASRCTELKIPTGGTDQYGRSTYREAHFEFFQGRDSPNHFPDIQATTIPEDATSDTTFQLLRKWLHDCDQFHEVCNQYTLRKFPRRLLDIRTPDCVKLYTTRPAEEQNYAILSHCWGKDTSQISTLTTHNFAEMEHGVNEASLSQSFRDAILITRKLHLKFLWIDALCIIQNSNQDWADESPNMGQYYQQSKVMISALWSSSDVEGFLPRDRTGCTGPIKFDDHDLFLRPSLPNALSFIHDDVFFEARPTGEQQHLNTRAWTLQERLFAPRILHCTKEQYIWQCKICIASEDNQHAFKIGRKNPTRAIDPIDFPIAPNTLPSDARPVLTNKWWLNLIQQFSSRQITFPSDLLPAISGIVDQMQKLLNGKYLAGIWDHEPRIFLRSLLWETDNPEKAKYANNGSPSWSWSAIQGAVNFYALEDMVMIPGDTDIKFLRKTVNLKTTNKYGQVDGGRILLEGHVQQYIGPETFLTFWQHRKRQRQRGARRGPDPAYRQVIGKIVNEVVSIEEEMDALDLGPSRQSTGLSVADTGLDRPKSCNPLTVYKEGHIEWNSDSDFWTIDMDVAFPQHDVENAKYVLLYMGRWNSSLEDEENKDYLSAQQFFLILKYVEESVYDITPSYVRIGQAHVSDPDFLEITEAQGWTKIELALI